MSTTRPAEIEFVDVAMRALTFATVLVAAAGTAPALAYDCSDKTHRVAKAKMELAFGLGILQNDPNHGLAVLIDDSYWTRMTFPQKTQFAEQLVCAIAGVGKGLTGITLKSLMTGKTVGEWSPLSGLTVP
jgi:hypothetical protein